MGCSIRAAFRTARSKAARCRCSSSRAKPASLALAATLISVVRWRHGLRNALMPVVTVVGLQFGALLGGAVIVEIDGAPIDPEAYTDIQDLAADKALPWPSAG